MLPRPLPLPPAFPRVAAAAAAAAAELGRFPRLLSPLSSRELHLFPLVCLEGKAKGLYRSPRGARRGFGTAPDSSAAAAAAAAVSAAAAAPAAAAAAPAVAAAAPAAAAAAAEKGKQPISVSLAERLMKIGRFGFEEEKKKSEERKLGGAGGAGSGVRTPQAAGAAEEKSEKSENENLNFILNGNENKNLNDVWNGSNGKGEFGFKYKGPEPTQYGDWAHKGRVSDF